MGAPRAYRLASGMRLVRTGKLARCRASGPAPTRQHYEASGTAVMPVREAALRPFYKKIDELITDKVKDFFEMADGYSDVVVKNGTPPQHFNLVSALALALTLALALNLALALTRQHRDGQCLREAGGVQQDAGGQGGAAARDAARQIAQAEDTLVQLVGGSAADANPNPSPSPSP